MFRHCPECGHYVNQCLKCSALVDIGAACVCPRGVTVPFPNFALDPSRCAAIRRGDAVPPPDHGVPD
eukprot:6404547-Prymnesium_polylepis.1